MKTKIISVLAILSVISLTGCTGTQTRLLSDAEDQEMITSALSDNDFDSAASTMIQSMLEEITNDKVYIMTITGIDNKTMQKINTDDLVDLIKRDLRRSGKVKTTNADMSSNNQNQAVYNVRQLNNSALFDQSTGIGNSKLTKIDLSLVGRIEQKNIAVNKKQKKIEYVFSLVLTDLASGTEMWSDKKTIKKLANKNDLTW